MYLKSEKLLVNQLKHLKKKFKLQGIKAEFEAEGSSVDDLSRLRRITNSIDTKLFIKIGGVEAINDLYSCIELGVNGIIAPMVETKFGLQKFIQSIKKFKILKKPHLSINIETKDGMKNHKEIINYSGGFIDNITIGRSDLSASYFNPSVTPDSEFIFKKILTIAKYAKKFGITTTVGGSISLKTIQTYSKKYLLKKLIHRLETRKVILPSNIFLKNKNALKEALAFEEKYIIYKKELSEMKLLPELSRLTILKTRN